MNFSDRLKKYMDDNLIKQKELAELIGVSKSYISMIIRGERSPNREFIERLVEISKKDANWWLHGIETYNNLYSLNDLIDKLIEDNIIKRDGSMDPKYREMLYRLLDSEIMTKLNSLHNVDKL